MTDKLTWQRSGNSLQVTNPTPFYMNFQEVKVAGQEVKDATYVAPWWYGELYAAIWCEWRQCELEAH
ncbi:fimbrial assembly chaperone SthB [Serratia fonticola]|uniref:Fimbrial assembly chaperone SthB n=1 Tax=Serratia fonticola TaxID=47917 RepID=A0A4U9WJN1_SERFO|nr:fimbrial assembly chaperone SthB [Serratia fonticola]